MSGGDSFRTTFTISQPKVANKSSVAAAVDDCHIDSSRAVAIEMRLKTVATSQLKETVGMTFLLAASNPGFGAVLMDYSSGMTCEPQATLSSVQFSISPSQSSTFTMWLIYENVITPKAPLGLDDQVALGHWFTQLAVVTINGQDVDSEELYGNRVITCEGITSSTYIVAAGELPTTAGSGCVWQDHPG